MTAHDLARAAEKVKKSTRRYTPLEPYIPAVDVLRRKGWSWAGIHTWLRAQGQRVHDCPSSFAASMSRCYRRWISREAARFSEKVEDASLPERSDAKISPGSIPLTEPPSKRPAARIQRLPRRKKDGKGNTTTTGDDPAATSPATPAEPAPSQDQTGNTAEPASHA